VSVQTQKGRSERTSSVRKIKCQSEALRGMTDRRHSQTLNLAKDSGFSICAELSHFVTLPFKRMSDRHKSLLSLGDVPQRRFAFRANQDFRFSWYPMVRTPLALKLLYFNFGHVLQMVNLTYR
jgi:hypothetical protein